MKEITRNHEFMQKQQKTVLKEQMATIDRLKEQGMQKHVELQENVEVTKKMSQELKRRETMEEEKYRKLMIEKEKSAQESTSMSDTQEENERLRQTVQLQRQKSAKEEQELARARQVIEVVSPCHNIAVTGRTAAQERDWGRVSRSGAPQEGPRGHAAGGV